MFLLIDESPEHCFSLSSFTLFYSSSFPSLFTYCSGVTNLSILLFTSLFWSFFFVQVNYPQLNKQFLLLYKDMFLFFSSSLSSTIFFSLCIICFPTWTIYNRYFFITNIILIDYLGFVIIELLITKFLHSFNIIYRSCYYSVVYIDLLLRYINYSSSYFLFSNLI